MLPIARKLSMKLRRKKWSFSRHLLLSFLSHAGALLKVLREIVIDSLNLIFERLFCLI